MSDIKNFVAMESDLDKYVEDKVNSLIGGEGGISLSSLGVTASAKELNYCKGVTSSIQTQLNGKVSYDANYDVTLPGSLIATSNLHGSVIRSSSDMQCNGNSCIYNGNHLLVYNNNNSAYTIALRGSDGYISGGVASLSGLSVANDSNVYGNSVIRNGNQLLLSKTSGNDWTIILRGSDGQMSTTGNISCNGTVSAASVVSKDASGTSGFCPIVLGHTMRFEWMNGRVAVYVDTTLVGHMVLN